MMRNPRKHAAVVFSSVLALGLCSCHPLAMLPVNEQTFRSDSAEVVGQLGWDIVDCEHGITVSAGSRPLLVRDVVIARETSGDGSETFDKRIDLDQSFYVTLAEFPEQTADDVGGFALMSGRGAGNSSWEWFDLESATHARKRQETGELTVAYVPVGPRWELGRTLFDTDVSLRVYDGGIIDVARNKPRWRIRIQKNSYIEWPSVLDGVIVVNGATQRPGQPN
jgi:hypothetical protein